MKMSANHSRDHDDVESESNPNPLHVEEVVTSQNTEFNATKSAQNDFNSDESTRSSLDGALQWALNSPENLGSLKMRSISGASDVSNYKSKFRPSNTSLSPSEVARRQTDKETREMIMNSQFRFTKENDVFEKGKGPNVTLRARVLLILRALFAIGILLTSFFYFTKQSTVSLIPYSSCNDCDVCAKTYVLQSQNEAIPLYVEVQVMRNGTKVDGEKQDMTFIASWKSCQQSGTVNMTPLIVQTAASATFPMNASNLLWDDKEYDESYEYYEDYRSNIISTTTMASLSGETYYGYYAEGNPLDDPCFILTCYVLDYFDCSLFDCQKDIKSYIEVQIQETNYEDAVSINNQIVASNKTAAGSCQATVYGQLIPFFSSGASIQESDAHLCTKYTSAASALASGAGFVLSADKAIVSFYPFFLQIIDLGFVVVIKSLFS